ncbi:MAG: phage tail sheath subtilisin-like domain-containing protein [Cyanobacteria bacterium J06635_1]
MVTNFQHGVITRYSDTVPRPVTVVPSDVIAIVGTAPIYRLDPEYQVINEAQRSESAVDDAAKSGPERDGFTIPYALDAIRDNNGGTVEIINVFDPATHKTTAQDIDYTFGTDDTIQLKRVTGTAPSQTVTEIDAEGITGTFTVTNAGGSTTYTLTTDYTYDAVEGILTRVDGGAITAGADVEVTYDYADPSQVVAADIIGGVTGGGSTFAGLSVLDTIFMLRGYKPKLIICPSFSDDDGVAAEMVSKAVSLGAYALIDAPIGATRDDAIAGRSGTAPVTNFDTSQRQVVLCYPHVYDSENRLQPLSQYAAGVIARTDKEFGYWWSPSNKEILGIIGLELDLTADPVSPSGTDVNALNAAGIVTVAKWFGSGYRLWGNRSALYPSDTTPLNFIAVGRTFDIFSESLARAAVPFVDRPINNALIDAVVDSGNGFIREQVVLGALLEGSQVYYDKAKNPATALAAGKIVFSVVIMPPTPAELITFDTTLDINLLGELGGSN